MTFPDPLDGYHLGDCRDLMRKMPAECVQTCVTSPPYWGLRDYGVDGQLGLERTPDEYVANMVEVFREVRRVLRADGTLWLNLGDSYAAGKAGRTDHGSDDPTVGIQGNSRGAVAPGAVITRKAPDGFKPKDLVGIPWRVAFALQQPYYTGSIRDERDRIWLAAMLDAEGCIFIHKRKAGASNGQGYVRQSDSYGPGVEIANTSLAVIERIHALVGKGSICSQGPEENGRRKQRIYRWNLRTVEARDFVREMYPYLVAKQQQARILINCPTSGEVAEASHEAIKSLHRTGASTFDAVVPESMFEPGYYLRSDVIWSKANPMPESVTDRPTKAHEYVFLMSKSERYWYDADAIKEESNDLLIGRAGKTAGKVGPTSKGTATGLALHSGARSGLEAERSPFRNRRTVWTIASEPTPDAHFATFPTKLVEPCILAGSRIGDLVLDPFGGSGTTGRVAEDLGRRWCLLDLNPEYAKIAKRKTAQIGLLGRCAP